jgi:shikimate kinase
MNRNMILCGFKSCGKSTLGPILAKECNWNFIDTDTLLEDFYSKSQGDFLSCREIFKKEGEIEFRRLEQLAIASLSPIKHAVIATGGGTMMDEHNVEGLKNLGKVIYLQVGKSLLWERFAKDPPAYCLGRDLRECFEELYTVRTQVYEAIADEIVDMDKENDNGKQQLWEAFSSEHLGGIPR